MQEEYSQWGIEQQQQQELEEQKAQKAQQQQEQEDDYEEHVFDRNVGEKAVLPTILEAELAGMSDKKGVPEPPNHDHDHQELEALSRSLSTSEHTSHFEEWRELLKAGALATSLNGGAAAVAEAEKALTPTLGFAPASPLQPKEPPKEPPQMNHASPSPSQGRLRQLLGRALSAPDPARQRRPAPRPQLAGRPLLPPGSNGMQVTIFDNEPTSIIAYFLASGPYQDYLKEAVALLAAKKAPEKLGQAPRWQCFYSYGISWPQKQH
jgi:hypothetical protein